ncbi:MAG TPA: hypothetical protein VJR23_01540 [Candidatus Acidoferrales bacterium]|nr:hypothetical protein [Candidatus Acidoferrales bacterium]
MNTKVNVYAIVGLTQDWEDEPFDLSQLPARILPDVTIEDVAPMFAEDAFALFKGELAPRKFRLLQNVKYAIVHRFQSPPVHDDSASKLEIGELVYKLAACLRLIRPMRQFATMIHGELLPGGRVQVTGFDHPVELMEVPTIQKNFTLRNRDISELRDLAPSFLAAMAGEFWKFRMPVSIYEPAHFLDSNWKARMSLFCSAIEAIYTSQTRDGEHSGSAVAKARIKWFLGESTSIYAPGDVPSFMLQEEPTIAEVLDDLYTVRNCVAHGDKVPDKYFAQSAGSLGTTNQLGILEEAASFIVRASLIKILKNNLLQHFKGGPESQAYFAGHGLVRSKLPKV